MPAGVELALAIEARMRACPGIAGLDPDSRLATVGPGHMVRGVRVSAPGGGRPAELILDLVGLADARLQEAAEAARGAVIEICEARGLAAGPVEVRVTEVATQPLPPQATATPAAAPRPAEPEPEPAPAPDPEPAPTPEAEPAPPHEPEDAPVPPPAAEPEPAARPSEPSAPAARTVRVEVEGPGGEPIVLAITVSVEVERP